MPSTIAKPGTFVIQGKEISAFIVLIIGAIFTYICYQQFFSSNWTFDGGRVFNDLEKVSDYHTAYQFITDNKEISPLGRPLSQASFLLNIGDWPSNPAGFRRVNTLIHILNGFILALVGLRIARAIKPLQQRATGFAIALATIWMMHPFLASTSFHAVQRMALLAGTFSLLSFYLYLIGREQLSRNQLLAGHLILYITIPFLCLLGVLSKENAALTPLLIAAAEITILSHYSPITTRAFSRLKILFFGIPLLGFIGYSTYYLLAQAQHGYTIRQFSISERLYSEALIMFDYARQILLPNISRMGPFQDDITYISHGTAITISAAIGWLAAIATALIIRKSRPLLAFPILFFVSGHLLESTYFNLELYFEHRNYIASIGILGTLTGIAWTLDHRLSRPIIGLYAALFAGLLWSVSSLWGHPVLGPLYWAENHPTSTRANQVATTMLWNIGQPNKAREIITNAYMRNPADSNLATNVLTYQCFNQNAEDRIKLTNRIIESASTIKFGRTIAQGLYTTLKLLQEGKCNNLTALDIARFIKGLLKNPHFPREDQRFTFYLILSELYVLEKSNSQAIDARIQAYKIKPWSSGAQTIYCDILSTYDLGSAEKFAQDIQSNSIDSAAGKFPALSESSCPANTNKI